MAIISRVGAASVEATSITIPAGHQQGDGMLMFAYNDGIGVPALPAGWTTLDSFAGGNQGLRVAYKLAGSSSETSGTWTTADGLVCMVYRGVAQSTRPPFRTNASTGTSTTLSFGVFNLRSANCWLAGFSGTRAIDSTIASAPTGMVNQTSTTGATANYAGHDTDGIYPGTRWPATTVSVGGTSDEWTTYVVEVVQSITEFNNYQFIDAPDGISVTEKIR